MTPSDLIASILRFALNSVFASLTLDPGRDVEDLKSEREAAAAMLASLNPRNAIEAALATRAVTAHHASMACFRRAALPDVPNAMMTRLIASGMALSRMSGQLIKALDQRKGSARPAASIDPSAAGHVASAAASVSDGQRQTGMQAPQGPGGSAPAGQHQTGTPRDASGGQHPMSSERRAERPDGPPALNRQERRRAAKQAARDARTSDSQRATANRQATIA